MSNSLPQKEKTKFKQMIADITLGPWLVLKVLDQKGNEMVFFEGPRVMAMRRIKRRIARQKPCIVSWHLVDGAEKLFIDGFGDKDSAVWYQ
jgi:hypothetical protein